jgi:hypothetical protein
LKAGDLKAWHQFPSLRLNAHQLNRSDAAPVIILWRDEIARRAATVVKAGMKAGMTSFECFP